MMTNITKQVRMLAKLGLRSMSFLERTRIEARFPEAIFSHEEEEERRRIYVSNVDDF